MPHVDAADWPAPAEPLYVGLLAENGAWLRNPRGGVEDVAEMKACGREWLALNVGDHRPDEWATVRTRAQRWSVDAFPWRRVRSAQDVYDLVSVAQQWAAAAVGVNLEKEAETVLPPALAADQLRSWPGEVILITEAWLYNDVDWTPLTRWPVVLEIFPAESAAAKDTAGCEAHARALGFPHVYPCYGAYAGMRPELYDLTTPHSVYTADDVGQGNWKLWSA